MADMLIETRIVAITAFAGIIKRERIK